jgi:hypothetical protein
MDDSFYRGKSFGRLEIIPGGKDRLFADLGGSSLALWRQRMTTRLISGRENFSQLPLLYITTLRNSYEF